VFRRAEEEHLPPSPRPARPVQLSAELHRRLDSVTHRVDHAITEPHPSVESLHQLHREMRRLLVGLNIWAQLLPQRERDALRPVVRRWKRLSRLVGQVRDHDVVLSLLEEVESARVPPEDARGYHEFLSRLRDDTRTGRELLRAFLRTEREARLLEEVGVAIDSTPLHTAGVRLRRLLAVETEYRWGRVRKAHRKARRRPTVDRLHRLRIRLRQLRHTADLVGIVDPQAVASIPVAFRRLQAHLGRLHDLDVALLTLDPERAEMAWGEALRVRRRRERRAARRALASLAVAPARRRRKVAPRVRRATVRR